MNKRLSFTDAMRVRRERAAFRVGSWLLRQSGSVGANEWARMENEVRVVQQWNGIATALKGVAVERFDKLIAVVRLADGLLSSGQPDRAQEQLRMALLMAPARRRAPSRGDTSNG